MTAVTIYVESVALKRTNGVISLRAKLETARFKGALKSNFEF